MSAFVCALDLCLDEVKALKASGLDWLEVASPGWVTLWLQASRGPRDTCFGSVINSHCIAHCAAGGGATLRWRRPVDSRTAMDCFAAWILAFLQRTLELLTALQAGGRSRVVAPCGRPRGSSCFGVWIPTSSSSPSSA